jgi:molybdopterin-binding protein
MPDEDFINLEDTVQTHEAELDRQTKEIAALKDDLKLVLECNPRSSESNQTSVEPPPTKIDALRQVSPGCAIDRRRRWMDFMQQSIRNEIPGTVKEIISDKALSEIIVETRIGEMAAVITTRSVQDTGLR